MSVYRDGKTGTWRVIYRYTDYTGERKQTKKRGFQTRREAVAWEHEQIIKTTASLDMTFGSFYERYAADISPRLKENTWNTKEHIIRTKILPYFQNRKMIEIKSRDIVAWQNELLTCTDKKGETFLPDLLENDTQPAERCFQSRDEVLWAQSQPSAAGRKYGKGRTEGNALLDAGGVPKVRRCHDGQAAILLRL